MPNDESIQSDTLHPLSLDDRQLWIESLPISGQRLVVPTANALGVYGPRKPSGDASKARPQNDPGVQVESQLRLLLDEVSLLGAGDTSRRAGDFYKSLAIAERRQAITLLAAWLVSEMKVLNDHTVPGDPGLHRLRAAYRDLLYHRSLSAFADAVLALCAS